MADTKEELRIGEKAKVVLMDVWQMRAIWQELKYQEEE